MYHMTILSKNVPRCFHKFQVMTYSYCAHGDRNGVCKQENWVSGSHEQTQLNHRQARDF